MKAYLLALVAMFCVAYTAPLVAQPPASATTASAQGQIKWYTNFNEAQTAAQKASKPLLLFFTGSDWCGWCKKIQTEVFSSPEFIRAQASQFIFVDVDFPMNKKLPNDIAQQNNQLKQKYGVTGFPTVIILDSDGNFIAETGYRPGGGAAYADYLRQLFQH